LEEGSSLFPRLNGKCQTSQERKRRECERRVSGGSGEVRREEGRGRGGGDKWRRGENSTETLRGRC